MDGMRKRKACAWVSCGLVEIKNATKEADTMPPIEETLGAQGGST
jgi:hypothetical protein